MRTITSPVSWACGCATCSNLRSPNPCSTAASMVSISAPPLKKFNPSGRQSLANVRSSAMSVLQYSTASLQGQSLLTRRPDGGTNLLSQSEGENNQTTPLRPACPGGSITRFLKGSFSMFDPRLEDLKRASSSYWTTRIASQLEYAHQLSRLAAGAHDRLIEGTIAALAERCGEEPITKAAALSAEAQLASLSAEAKRYRLTCAGHAHIDMNWMWRFDETVQVCLDTFRTVLDLMRDFPDLKFSQSQAAVYRIT